MTFDQTLRAYAFGMISTDRMRQLIVDMPAFKAWLKREARVTRTIVELEKNTNR